MKKYFSENLNLSSEEIIVLAADLIRNESLDSDLIDGDPGSTLLNLSTDLCREGAVKIMLELGADVWVEYRNYPQFALALSTCVSGIIKASWRFVKDFNRPFGKNGVGRFLCVSSYWNLTEFSIKMAKEGADVNCKNQSGYTPLHFAYMYGNKEYISFLKEAGAESVKNNAGYFPEDLTLKKVS